MYYLYESQYTNQKPRIMTVTGVGNIFVAPNVVHIQLEVSTENEQLVKAQLENADVMREVIESLVEAGINQEAIKTVSYNIYPKYDFIDGKQVFRGYEVINAIEVRITNVEQVGGVIDLAVKNGVNRVSNIRFTVENEQTYYQEALNLALINAQAKSQTIAKTMKLQLNPQPIEIEEEFNQEPIAYRTFSIAEMNTSTPIEQGQIKISATVRVQFQY